MFCYGKTVEVVRAQKLGKGDLVTVVGKLFNSGTKKSTGCSLVHLSIRAVRVYLLVKARSSES